MSINRSGQFRKKKIHFTQVSNMALRDPALSLKAKGLYSLINSYITMENYTLYKNKLKQDVKEGEKAFESTWNELKSCGYLIQYRLQDPKTKQFYYEYELLDEADIELANKIHNSQNRKKQEEKSHTPKKVGMDNGYSGKVGVYNNTNLNNINLNNTTSSSSSIQTLAELYVLFEEAFNKKPSSYMKKKIDTFIENSNLEFVIEVLNYCIEHNANSPSYLFKTLEELISKNVNTVELFEQSIDNHYKDLASKKKAKKQKVTTNGKTQARKVNFTQREYDFNALEDELLGYDLNDEDSYHIPDTTEILNKFKEQ